MGSPRGNTKVSINNIPVYDQWVKAKIEICVPCRLDVHTITAIVEVDPEGKHVIAMAVDFCFWIYNCQSVQGRILSVCRGESEVMFNGMDIPSILEKLEDQPTHIPRLVVAMELR